MTTLVPKYQAVNSSGVISNSTNRSISSIIPQVYSGTTYNNLPKLSDSISVKDFLCSDGVPVQGDGVHDDTTGIQNAINYSATNGNTIFMPVGTYLVTTTLNIVNDGVSIMGGGSMTSSDNSTTDTKTYGTTIKFTGSGACILIKSGTTTPVQQFIENCFISNLRIHCTSSATYGLDVYKALNSRFTNLAILGISDSSNNTGNLRNSLIRIHAGVNNMYEFLNLNGSAFLSDITKYSNCLTLTVLAGEPATTTYFNQCYFEYGLDGAFVDSVATFNDCIFESCVNYAIECYNASETAFNGCWFEGNTSFDGIFGLNASAMFYDCLFINYASNNNSYFVTYPGSPLARLNLNGCRFFYDATTIPYLFAANEPFMNTPLGNCTITNCAFPSNFQLGGLSGNTYSSVRNVDMPIARYSYIKTSVASGAVTVNPVPATTGLTYYIIPQAGHLLGLNIFTSGSTGGGTYSASLLQNGNTLPNLISTATSTTSSFTFAQPYLYPCTAGDVITISLSTTGITTGISIVIEAVVALGQSGAGIPT